MLVKNKKHTKGYVLAIRQELCVVVLASACAQCMRTCTCAHPQLPPPSGVPMHADSLHAPARHGRAPAHPHAHEHHQQAQEEVPSP